MGSMQRNKGQRAERQVIELLQPIVDKCYENAGFDPPKLKRNSLQSDGGGADIAGLMWLALEVKHQEAENLTSWWRQCLDQAESGQIPVLFYRRNQRAFKVRMFGIAGTPGCGYRCPVDIDVESFVVWFEKQLTARLEKGRR